MDLVKQKNKENSSELTIVKSNAIINAHYKLTLAESRLLLACISQIDSTTNRDANVPFVIHVSEIHDLVKHETADNLYRDLKEAVRRLFDRYIIVTTAEKTTKTRWISEQAIYNTGEGKVELRFTPEVLEYLSGLQGSFTQYKLQYVAKFTNVYSVRIYELLAQWQGRGSREIGVDELREKLQLGNQYPNTYDFKRHVVDRAVADINKHSNLTVEYGQRKSGRSVVAFQFKFKQKDAAQNSKRLSKDGIKAVIEQHARVGESYPAAEARLRRDGVITG
jgi:plasmid replication initiation protein